MDKHVEALANTNGLASSPITAQMFAAAGVEHMKKYGNNYDIDVIMSMVIVMILI